jgi:hypothetical protein
MPNIPTNLNTLSNEQIDALIKEMIDYYNSNNNSFSGTDGGAYITYIPTMLAQLQKMVGANPATNLQEMIQNDTKIDLDILQAKEDMKTAESRAISLRETDKQSYYESWFPLNRPLRTSSNLIILSLGIFFFVLSFLIIINSAGFSIIINSTWAAPNAAESPILQKLKYLFPFGYGTTLLILVIIIIAVVGYLRNA